MRAFLSYQTEDRHVAAEVRSFLESIAVPAFMAHDDINVSHEWRDVILAEISQADIFIVILSARYLASYYCLQESGIAAFRGAMMTIIPLSIDGTIPPGFMAHVQSKAITPGHISNAVLFAGIAKYDRAFAIDSMITKFLTSRSWAAASSNLAILKPYLAGASDDVIREVLHAAAVNPEIAHSFDCRETLRDLLETHGAIIEEKDRDYLESVFN